MEQTSWPKFQGLRKFFGKERMLHGNQLVSQTGVVENDDCHMCVGE